MVRTVRAGGFGRIDRMFDAPSRQVSRQGSTTVRTGLAFGRLARGGGLRWWAALFRFLRPFLLGLRRRVPGTLFLGDLCARLLGMLANARFEFFGTHFLGAGPEEAALEKRHLVFQVPADRFEFSDLRGESLGLRGETLGSCGGFGQGLAQPLIIGRQNFRGRRRTHGQSRWRKWRLSG